MTPERELELLRAEMRRQIRKEGISLTNRTFRELGQRVEEINRSDDLEVPTTLEEVLEIYYTLVHEMMTTRFGEMEDMIQARKTSPSEERKESPKPRRTTTTGGIPGPAFTEHFPEHSGKSGMSHDVSQ
jgi:hypothetical protein